MTAWRRCGVKDASFAMSTEPASPGGRRVNRHLLQAGRALAGLVGVLGLTGWWGVGGLLTDPPASGERPAGPVGVSAAASATVALTRPPSLECQAAARRALMAAWPQVNRRDSRPPRSALLQDPERLAAITRAPATLLLRRPSHRSPQDRILIVRWQPHRTFDPTRPPPPSIDHATARACGGEHGLETYVLVHGGVDGGLLGVLGPL